MMDSQENTTPKGIEEEQKAEAAAPVTNVDNENDVKEDAKAVSYTHLTLPTKA